MADRPEDATTAGPGCRARDGTSWSPVVLHVDMDAFFASVEVLDDPSLAGLPVIVGGSGGRGVVAACTYEARRFGVHSAMPSSTARRLCPDAVFREGRYHRYVEESAKLHAILESVTPLVEGISLDEAFLDVTGAQQLLGDAGRLATDLRARITGELGLGCSVGVGRTKLVAKLASEAAKPVASQAGIHAGRGVVVVPPEEELRFLHAQSVRALWGVGPVTGRRLGSFGVETVADLAALPADTLRRVAGPTAGAHLAELARGHDPRPVVPDRAAKSIGHEETFATDLWERAVLHRHTRPSRGCLGGGAAPVGPRCRARSPSRSNSPTSACSPVRTHWTPRSTRRPRSPGSWRHCSTRSSPTRGCGCSGSACRASWRRARASSSVSGSTTPGPPGPG